MLLTTSLNSTSDLKALSGEGSPHGIVVNVLDHDIIVSLNSSNARLMPLGKDMKPSLFPLLRLSVKYAKKTN